MNYSSGNLNLEELVIPISAFDNLEFQEKTVPPLPETMEIWDMSDIKHQWTTEPWDNLVPNDGFIYDFVLAHRGYGSPTSFWIWGGIMAVSTMLGRDAWLEWGDDKMFLNFFTLFVGRAGLVYKSTAIIKAGKVLAGYIDYIPSEVIAFQKETPTQLGKVSEASLYMVMENKKQAVLDEDGNTVTIESDGKIFLSVSELATMINKQSYSGGIVEKLTDMYDCKEYDSEATRSRGESKLKNIYCTFAGATTPEGLKDSIPESAFGGGFMSRLTTIYEAEPTRLFHVPIKMIGTPKLNDLRQRLAWLAIRARGEFKLSPEAEKYYSNWFYKWKKQLMDDVDSKDLNNRQDIITLKLATLLCAQRYNSPIGMENIITKTDYIRAEKIIKKSNASAARVMEKVGQDKFFFNLDRVKVAIRNYANKNEGKAISRAMLLKRLSSKKVTSKEVNAILQQLLDTDQLGIYDSKMTPQLAISSNTKELYTLTEGA